MREREELSNKEILQLNDLESFISFVPTWIYEMFLSCPENVIALFTGNQFGKTAGVAHSYVLRILGIHPIPVKNVLYFECEKRDEYRRMKDGEEREERKREYEKRHVRWGVGREDFGTFGIKNLPKSGKCPRCGARVVEHQRKCRVFRFCAQTLPGQSPNTVVDGESAEVKNTQYPAFKRWLPKFLIKEDITFRNPAMVIYDPHNRGDIIVEFVSYSQKVQTTAGTQRLSVWYDEEPDQDFRGEQIPRLIQEDGDEIFTLTPANYISWMFDDIYEKARVYFRTKKICEFLESQDTEGETFSEVTEVESGEDIAVLQASTFDNPTLTKEAIERMTSKYSDPDDIAIRLYGIFKQVSGRIFKDFSYSVHLLSERFVEEFFPEGIPHGWRHARGIDYHPQTPWAFGVISLSPRNEAFVWMSEEFSPEKFTTKWIAQEIAEICGDYKFDLDLIDPLSEAHKEGVEGGRTITIREVLNETFRGCYRDGIGTGANWRSWDTKGEVGRDAVKERLKNSLSCKKPFNNEYVGLDGEKHFLPTIWVFPSCRVAAKSMRQWRWEQYTDIRSAQVKGAKNRPEQKWSHMNMVWEAVFKNTRFRPKREREERVTRTKRTYYSGSRRGRGRRR